MQNKRNETCCIMMAIEPLAGKRIVEVKERKTKKDYALFMKKVEKAYRKAKNFILVQDNLNTHNPSSFYETFSPKSAFRLLRRFQMAHTPKKASWLNMAEIGLSTLLNQRDRQKATVSWQFTKDDAREKLDRHYRKKEKL